MHKKRGGRAGGGGRRIEAAPIPENICALAQTAIDGAFEVMQPYKGLSANHPDTPDTGWQNLDALATHHLRIEGQQYAYSGICLSAELGSTRSILAVPNLEMLRKSMGFCLGHQDLVRLQQRQAHMFTAVGTGRCRHIASWLLLHLHDAITEHSDADIRNKIRVAYCSLTGYDHAFITLLRKPDESEPDWRPICFIDPWQEAKTPIATFAEWRTGISRRPELRRSPFYPAGIKDSKDKAWRYHILAIGGGGQGLRFPKPITASDFRGRGLHTLTQQEMLCHAVHHVFPLDYPTMWFPSLKIDVPASRKSGLLTASTFHTGEGYAFPRGVLPEVSLAEFKHLVGKGPDRHSGFIMMHRGDGMALPLGLSLERSAAAHADYEKFFPDGTFVSQRSKKSATASTVPPVAMTAPKGMGDSTEATHHETAAALRTRTTSGKREKAEGHKPPPATSALAASQAPITWMAWAQKHARAISDCLCPKAGD